MQNFQSEVLVMILIGWNVLLAYVSVLHYLSSLDYSWVLLLSDPKGMSMCFL